MRYWLFIPAILVADLPASARQHALLAGTTASIVALQERETVYQANGYTVYREQPSYCTMYIDTDAGSMMRLSLHGGADMINFSWVNERFRVVQVGEPMTVSVRFDEASRWDGFGGIGYTSGDDRWGFAFTMETSFLDQLARGRSMSLSLDLTNANPLEIIDLSGSARAVAALKTCAGGVVGSTSRQVEADAPSDDGGMAGPARTFPSGERVVLEMDPGGHMANSGRAIYTRPGQPPRTIEIPYAFEAGEILAPNRFTFIATGQQNIACGAATWTTEYTVDWNRRRIVRERIISQDDGCD